MVTKFAVRNDIDDVDALRSTDTRRSASAVGRNVAIVNADDLSEAMSIAIEKIREAPRHIGIPHGLAMPRIEEALRQNHGQIRILPREPDDSFNLGHSRRSTHAREPESSLSIQAVSDQDFNKLLANAKVIFISTEGSERKVFPADLKQYGPTDDSTGLPSYARLDDNLVVADDGSMHIWGTPPTTPHQISYGKGIVSGDVVEGSLGRGTYIGTGMSQVLGQVIYQTELIPSPTKQIRHHVAYVDRIKELRGYAADDEDIAAVNEDSIRDFWTFMGDMESTRESGLVLEDNGNLRAVWRDEAGHNVGLEFLGGGLILYVMFKPFTDGRKTLREADVASFDVVVDRLNKLGLRSFVSI